MFNLLSIALALLRFSILSITISELGIAKISVYPPFIAANSMSTAGKLLLSGYLVWV